MGYLIRMAPEVEQWLAAVRDRDPAAADLIDEAVAALRAGGESVGPPLVVPLDDRSLNARPDLDTAYERQLEVLTRARRAVADVATSRKRLELQANQLEQQIGKLELSRRTHRTALPIVIHNPKDLLLRRGSAHLHRVTHIQRLTAAPVSLGRVLKHSLA